MIYYKLQKLYITNLIILNFLVTVNVTLKNVGKKWVSLCCTVGYKWVTVLDGVKFEYNDII